MSKILSRVLRSRILPANAKLIYILLYLEQDENSQICILNSVLADKLSTTSRLIQRHIFNLKVAGFLKNEFNDVGQERVITLLSNSGEND